ncbi:MAG: type II secretion system protein [Phycisphaerae bacterium]
MSFRHLNNASVPGSCRPCRRGFTLVELLVVIAIISLLVSILLPSLKSARDRAKTALCQTNMGSIADAVTGYAAGHNDLLVWYRISPSDNYRDGDFFTNQLVRSGAIDAPNIDDVPANEDFSVFRCPTGLSQQCLGTWGDWDPYEIPPISAEWRKWWYDPAQYNDFDCPEIAGTAVRTWYSLNATNKSESPFTIRENERRRLSKIQRSSELVMVFEGSRAFQIMHSNHIAGNHPPYDKLNGMTNVAFFDGSVGTYNTDVFVDWDHDDTRVLSRDNKPITHWSSGLGTR